MPAADAQKARNLSTGHGRASGVPSKVSREPRAGAAEARRRISHYSENNAVLLQTCSQRQPAQRMRRLRKTESHTDAGCTSWTKCTARQTGALRTMQQESPVCRSTASRGHASQGRSERSPSSKSLHSVSCFLLPL